jgi:hypothetical protein
MRGPQVPITCRWYLNLDVPPLVEFEMIAVGFEGAAAVEGQLGLIERDTVECRIGHGLVRL